MSPSKYPQRRLLLLAFVQAYLAQTGCTPSALTASRALGWSQAACQGYLRRLRSELSLPPPPPPGPRFNPGLARRLQALIAAHTAQHGAPPSLRWLASETGASPATLKKYLKG